MSESALVKSCLALCKAHPKVGKAWRVNAGWAKRGPSRILLAPKGCPDIHGWLKGGRSLQIECKAPDAKPRKDQDHQLAWAAEATADGVLMLRVSSVETLQAALDSCTWAEDERWLRSEGE